ncbi:MAG: hypothetical protein DMF52_10295, partial [Acidobacteria bacterium]
MCGIAGIVSLDRRPVDPREIGSMCSVMVHRGPDDEGLYAGSGAALGMRRLSIIDPARGRQPLCNEDGTIWAVCNGEIYNFKELRDDLERRGHSFCSGSDSETIVHLYEEFGRRCVERMRGMFAMALWDEGRRELLLARDRVGIKPLYYAVAGGRLVFASELKAILQLPDVERRLDWGAINHLFTFLSGGIDSSSVVATMARLSSGPVKTFSIGFDEKDYDELRYARLVAERFGTEHHELVVTPDVVDIVDDLAWFLDEPFGDSSAIPTYVVSRLASQF